jgi:hypothetical protein
MEKCDNLIIRPPIAIGATMEEGEKWRMEEGKKRRKSSNLEIL